ncbi:MAG TPA: CPBP family intramembrane glutamic endopeptidase [Thermoguttaceae bacterium]|nr:CPBP family intramembrane glutamic endopeptidase [Thermoguttaceae bacterium]
MSDDQADIPAEESLEPTLLPENPYASPREPVAPPWEPDGSPCEPIGPSWEQGVSRRRPRVWTVWLVFVLSAFVNLGGVVAVLIGLVVWEYGPETLASRRFGDALREVSTSLVGLLITVSWTMVVFFVTAVAAAALSPVDWRERLRFRPARISAFGVGIHVCGVLAIGLVFGALLELGILPQSPSLAELTDLITGLSGGALWAVVLVIGIAPGIAEELLFRGYIQTRFSRRWGPGWGVLWTALLFGVMHFDFIHGVFAFALGVYLGYLTEWTGSIVPAMICHAANNTYQTLATAWGFDVTGDAANVAGLLVGVLVLGLSIWHLRARVKPKGSDPS